MTGGAGADGRRLEEGECGADIARSCRGLGPSQLHFTASLLSSLPELKVFAVVRIPRSENY